jgi:hypothetical protein
MDELIDITDVRPLEDRWVRLWFSDGSVKDVDLGTPTGYAATRPARRISRPAAP